MLCNFIGCKEKAVTWINKKRYCDIHDKIVKSENKIKRRQNIDKVSYCSVEGCGIQLGFSNKCGMCSSHRDLEKMNNSRLKKEKKRGGGFMA